MQDRAKLNDYVIPALSVSNEDLKLPEIVRSPRDLNNENTLNNDSSKKELHPSQRSYIRLGDSYKYENPTSVSNSIFTLNSGILEPEEKQFIKEKYSHLRKMNKNHVKIELVHDDFKDVYKQGDPTQLKHHP